MSAEAFYQAALALALGMTAQVAAGRFALPSIVLLLAVGVAAGPDGLGLLDPSVFGEALGPLVTLGVTVILFEGGLALRVDELRRQQTSLLLLLTLGSAISMSAGMLAAHYALGLPWSIAALFGALVIVTGPTVVTPLLARLPVDRPLRELLIGEAVLIDPVGAIVAIVAAESVLGSADLWQAGAHVLTRLGVGAALGAGAGVALGIVLQRGWIPQPLRNPCVLGAVLVVAALASRLSPEAGLMAAVAQGMVMANSGLREIGPLRQFKEELTVLLLSFLFVLLAAKLRLSSVQALGWPALSVVAVLCLVARPLSVFLCTLGSELSVRQRLFASWINPRGIVAASVAGLFGILLADAGIAGGESLEALVFVTVALTVTVQGLTAGPVARLLGVDLPALRETIVVGAGALGRLIARLLIARGRSVVLLDSNPRSCRVALSEGLPALQGDALSFDDLDEAGVRRADTVLAATTNHSLNVLIAQRVRESFRVERVLAASDRDAMRGAEGPFPGNFPGVNEITQRLLAGGAHLLQYELSEGEALGRKLADLDYGPGEFALLVERRERVYVATGGHALAAGDKLLCLAPTGGERPLATLLQLVSESAAKTTVRGVRRRDASR